MKKHCLFTLALTAIALTSPARSATPNTVTYERNVLVPMRDGVKLHADIYRPDAEGKYPVLLTRTPYDKNNAVAFGLQGAARGYVVIIQDVRGRYTSEGTWYPFKNEPNDGYDTVEWAAALPYSNGKVGMFGGSYVGATQMLTAIAHPPHLAGICPVVTASNYHENWTYQGGALEQWFDESWTTQLAADTLNRDVASRTDPLNGIMTLPAADYPLLRPKQKAQGKTTTRLAPYLLDWLDHPNFDDYWKSIAIENHYADITVPALNIAAWYDIFQGGSLRNYMGIKALGGTDTARHGQQLMVIVGGHAGNGPKIGDVDFGPGSHFDQDETTLRWYDYLFKGVQNEVASG